MATAAAAVLEHLGTLAVGKVEEKIVEKASDMARRGRKSIRAYVRSKRRSMSRKKTKRRKTSRSSARLKKVGFGNRKMLGSPPKTSTAKSHLVRDDLTLAIQSKDLYFQEVITMPLYGGVGKINSTMRTADAVTISGLDICMHIVNKHTVPMLFHTAIVQRKNTTDNFADNFFRQDGNGSKISQGRSYDFDNDLSGWEMNCLNMSPDNMIILEHKRYTIHGRTGIDASAKYNNMGRKNWKDIDRYIPIKRQFRFNDLGQPDTPLIMYWWFSFPDEIVGSLPQTGFCDISMKIQTFFQNPKL